MDYQVPAEIIRANVLWGANCGPAALAAAFQLPIRAVRDAVCGDGQFCGYMNIPAMKAAIAKVGSLGTGPELPRIAVVNWIGPWSTVPKAQATKRHWITMANGQIYDINSGWVDPKIWREDVVPDLLPKRAEGHAIYLQIPVQETDLTRRLRDAFDHL